MCSLTSWSLGSTKENAYWSCRLFRNHSRGYCAPVPRVSFVMPCDVSVWAPFWTGYVAHIPSISCAKTHAVKWSLAMERLQLVIAPYFHFFRSFPKGKWSFVDLFEFLLANMAKLRMRISESCVAVLCFPWNSTAIRPCYDSKLWCVNSVAFLRRFNFSVHSYLCLWSYRSRLGSFLGHAQRKLSLESIALML